MSIQLFQSRMRLGLLITLAVCAGACSRDPSAPSDESFDISAAKGTSTTDMSVSSATPDSATQDTTLDVVINGSGFVSGTQANWSLAGVQDPAQVRTNGTRYVSSRQLVANITIAASATPTKWDIVVTAAGKKGGIGTEAFTVKPKGNVDTHSRVNYVIADQVEVNGVLQPAGIKGDGRLKDGSLSTAGGSEYQGDFCGVTGLIFNQPRENGNLQIDGGDGTNQSCGGPRFYVFNLNGQLVNSAPMHRVFDIWSLGVGQTVSTGQGFGVDLTGCSLLMFNSQYGGDNLKVTRTDNGTGPRQWTVESQGNHLAACIVPSKRGGTYVATGVMYNLPFSMVVTEVPYPYPTYP